MNNTAVAQTFVGPNADLTVTKTASPGPYFPGDPITFTTVVTNDGPDAVRSVTVSESAFVLPRTDPQKGNLFISVTPSQGSCGAPVLRIPIAEFPEPFWVVTCTLGEMKAGSAAKIISILQTPEREAYKSTAFANPAANDPNPLNNIATATVDMRGLDPATVPMLGPGMMLLFTVALAGTAIVVMNLRR